MKFFIKLENTGLTCGRLHVLSDEETRKRDVVFYVEVRRYGSVGYNDQVRHLDMGL